MNEKVSYIVLANEPGGTPTGYRVMLRDLASGRQAFAQFDTAFAQVAVDDRPRDYEAPEWKAEQLLAGAGLEDPAGFIEALKQHLRAMLDASLSA